MKLQWEAQAFFSESDTVELLLVTAFCSLAGTYSGCELFRFCLPKHELAFIIHYSLRYLNSGDFVPGVLVCGFFLFDLLVGWVWGFCCFVLVIRLPICMINMG